MQPGLLSFMIFKLNLKPEQRNDSIISGDFVNSWWYHKKQAARDAAALHDSDFKSPTKLTLVSKLNLCLDGRARGHVRVYKHIEINLQVTTAMHHRSTVSLLRYLSLDQSVE